MEPTTGQNTPRARVGLNTPISSTVTQNSPQPVVEPNPPVGPTPSQNSPQEVVEAKQPTATQNTPQATVSESSQGKLPEAIKSLNTFSNYCYATLSADHALIAQIADPKARARLMEMSQAVEQSVDRMVARQAQYFSEYTPGPEADASFERSIPKMITGRASETNNLDHLKGFIQQAMSKN
jgi:hypothetical protein